MKQKISVVINTYNADLYLEKVLDSVKTFDEIVVCDMESNDNTLAIAAKYGCKIVTFPKGDIKICEPARNFAIQSATNSWVLVLDADEIVPDILREFLYDSIKDPNANHAFDIPRINMFMGQHIIGSPDRQLRFFRKEKADWPSIIHSSPKIDGKVIKLPYKKELCLIHLDNPTIEQRVAKINNYSNYEVPKRFHKKYGIFSILFRPHWFFIKSLLFSKGYRYGKKGFFRAYMDLIYQITILAKLYEAKTAANNK